MSNYGRETRVDAEVVARLEKAIARLDNIVRGNPELGVEDGLMQSRRRTEAKLDTLIADVAALKAKVERLEEESKANRRMLYINVTITLILAVAVGLALYAAWGVS